MNKNLKIKALTSFSMICSALFASQANAYCGPPPDVMPPPIQVPTPPIFTGNGVEDYKTAFSFKQCWALVEGHSFTGDAEKRLDELKMSYQETYHEVLMGVVKASHEKQVTSINLTSSTLQRMLLMDFEAERSFRAKLENDFMDNKLTKLRELEESKFNNKNQGIFPSDAREKVVDPTNESYEFYKGMCQRNKMSNEIISKEFKDKKTREINKNIMRSTIEMSKQTGSTSEKSTTIALNHLSNYCTAEDIHNNLCQNEDLKLCVEGDTTRGVCSVSENEILPTANLNQDATNLLSPAGFNGRYDLDGKVLEEPSNRIENEFFDIENTYTEEQAQAANDMANLIIYQSGVPAPTSKEKQLKSKQAYVSRYNGYIAQLNLASATYQNAIAARKIATTGEINMSERDILRYVINNLTSPEQINKVMSGKDKARELHIYQLTTLSNKLDLMLDETEERIELLTATMVTQKVNSPERIKELSGMRER